MPLFYFKFAIAPFLLNNTNVYIRGGLKRKDSPLLSLLLTVKQPQKHKLYIMDKYFNKLTFTSFTGGVLLGSTLPQVFALKDRKEECKKDGKDHQQYDDQCNCYTQWTIHDDLVYAVVSGIL